MMFKTLTVATALATLASAQRPANISICDYYTTALLMNNTGANQMTLLTLVVNTAVIGNYTKPNVGISVAGILAPGEFNGTAVDLAPYFNGGLASTNQGGSSGVSKNFLDGGGAAPLLENKPANDDSSMQYMLLTHLYSYFGGLLGCTQMGADFPAYSGSASMYETHKFMDLSAAEVGYFITQVANSAASFGVAAEDLAVVGTALSTLFGHKCSPAVVVIPSQPAELQSICIGEDCPLDPKADCDAYGAAVVEPSTAIPSLFPNSTATATGSVTGTAAASSAASSAASKASSAASAATGTGTATGISTGAAPIATGVGMGVLAAGFAALLL